MGKILCRNPGGHVTPLAPSWGAHATVYEPKQYRAYRLDRFWSDQEVLYDYKTDLHGIVNRSIV